MAKTVALLGAFDTKGGDFAFLKQRIEQNGFATLTIDFGVLGTPTLDADISRTAVAAAAGRDLAALAAGDDRGDAVTAMTEGATAHVLRLFGQGRIHAIMAMGGGAATTLGTAVMRRLPIGFPKLMVSTLVGATNLQPYIGSSDIVMMPSVVDVAGLNRISRMIYSGAADAICGMVNWSREAEADSAPARPLIAATMFGMTTPCLTRASKHLEARGYEVLVFHANGGGRVMESLIEDGLIDGVLDITTTELADELLGGTRSAGPKRLEAAARKGVPQVVSLGALDAVNFGTPDTVPQRFAGRRFYRHNAQTTLMRTSPQEAAELGRIIAGKLNAAAGPVLLLLPLRGFSNLDAKGQAFEDREADAALIAALHRHVDSARVRLREVDAHINDPSFADLAAESLLGLMEEHARERAAKPA
jgi:uncharacterized protein (UPF0261 family)